MGAELASIHSEDEGKFLHGKINCHTIVPLSQLPDKDSMQDQEEPGF